MPAPTLTQSSLPAWHPTPEVLYLLCSVPRASLPLFPSSMEKNRLLNEVLGAENHKPLPCLALPKENLPGGISHEFCGLKCRRGRHAKMIDVIHEVFEDHQEGSDWKLSHVPQHHATNTSDTKAQMTVNKRHCGLAYLILSCLNILTKPLLFMRVLSEELLFQSNRRN